MNKQWWFAMLIAVAGICVDAEPTKVVNEGADNAQFENNACKKARQEMAMKIFPFESAEACRAAAEQGNAEAQFFHGMIYATGSGVEKNDSEAVKWYRKAADQGNIQAQYILATRYAYGLGVATNYAEAVKLYRHVAEHRFTRGEFAGCHFFLLLDMIGDAKKDTVLLEKSHRALELGEIPPARSVGDIYWKGGWGIEKNEPEAAQWYRTAADSGDRYSMRTLGDVYLYGRGAAKDVAEAIKWFHKAAEGGEKDVAECVKWDGEVKDPKWKAYYGLACCYLSGEGVDRDVLEAAKWGGKWFITCHTIWFVLTVVVIFVVGVCAVNKLCRKVAERRRGNAIGENEGQKETVSQGEGNI